MKKKEIVILAVIAVLSLAALAIIRFMPKKSTPASSDTMPEGEAKGIWVAAVNRGKAILYFDSGVDAEYTITGNVGDMTIEVADGMWHVKEVECYDYTCKNMGWASQDSLLPIICLPNDIVIVDAETAENMLAENGNGN